MEPLQSNPVIVLRSLLGGPANQSYTSVPQRWAVAVWGQNEFTPEQILTGQKVVYGLVADIHNSPEADEPLQQANVDLRRVFRNCLVPGRGANHTDSLNSVVKDPKSVLGSLHLAFKDHQSVDRAKLRGLVKVAEQLIEDLAGVTDTEQIIVTRSVAKFLEGEVLPLLKRSDELNLWLLGATVLDEMASRGLTYSIQLNASENFQAGLKLFYFSLGIASLLAGPAGLPLVAAGLSMSTLVPPEFYEATADAISKKFGSFKGGLDAIAGGLPEIGPGEAEEADRSHEEE